MALDPTSVRAAIREIEAAFAGLAPPGDAKLKHPLSMDDVDIVDFYGAPDWRDIADETIVAGYAAPSFFSAEAFQYYMPAFMVYSLRHYDSVEFAPESTVWAFDPAALGDEDLRRFQISKFALFTDPQRRAAVRFLETLAPDPELGPLATNALANYWAPSDAAGA